MIAVATCIDEHWINKTYETHAFSRITTDVIPKDLYLFIYLFKYTCAFIKNRKQNIRKQNGIKLNAGKERKKEMILKIARKRNETIREKSVRFENVSLI